MKKLFTILFSFGIMTAVVAQPRNRDHSKGGPVVIVKTNDRNGYDNHERRYAEQRNAQLHRINREFDARIMAVRSNRRLRAGEKSRQVRMLEKQRIHEIREINSRYSKGNNRYDDHYGKVEHRKW